MGKKDPRIDAYIGASAGFAKPVLTHLRSMIHKGCPGVEETIKWGHPAFTHKGFLCMFAAFKEHCTLSFWKGSLVLGAGKGTTGEAMGQFGRITSLRDLPGDALLLGYIRTAVRLNDEGVTRIRKITAPAQRKVTVPGFLKDALRSNLKAKSAFEGFTYSKKKDYVEWLTGAKTAATREKRLATAIEWLSQGKSRNWKYER